tara:strand:- start:64 stop:762 length:699 start_codon:yes stop_codon:yes gene_type:complete
MNHIVCVKWGNKFLPEYVNVLKSMCERHTTVPFTFHCFTENPKGLNPDINVIALPNDPARIKTWWSKLYMFSPDVKLDGTILFFDLDVVIFKNIDELFTFNKDKFMIIHDFNRCRVKDWKQSNSSVLRWQGGTMNYIWNEYSKDPKRVTSRNHGDQDWIMKVAEKDINWWPDEWIRSYKWEMQGRKDTKLRRGAKHIFQNPPTINESNKVAVFHGEPKPFNCGDQFVIDNWK